MALYKPGQEAPFTGVYQVVHAGEHKRGHQVIANFGEKFLPCRDCGEGVGFKLQHSAISLRADRSFA